MKHLSITSHLWIAFLVIPIITFLILGILQSLGTYETPFQSVVLNIAITLLLTSLLGYFHARRIHSTIKSLLAFIQALISQDDATQAAIFPRFAPREFELMAEHFQLMAKKHSESRQELSALNAELEQRIAERTNSLLRTNQELAILNQLITPISPHPGGASIIKECLRQFSEISGVHVKLYLRKPVLSLIGSGEDIRGINDIEINDKPWYIISYRYTIQPIRSGNNIFGCFIIPHSQLSQQDRDFVETLSRSAGIIFQNEILSRTLEQNHAVLKAVLESMYDAITLINGRQVVYANGRMSELLALPCSEIIGMSEDYLFAIIAHRLIDANWEVIDQAKRGYGVFNLKLKHGVGHQYILLTVFPVTGNGNDEVGKGMVWRDITKEHEVDKLKNDLISMVSHEFKTPITSIRGSVETLLREDADWEEDFKREMLTGIHEDIEHVQELVNDWLDISRIEAKAISLDKEPVQPHAIITSAIRKLPKHFASNAKIESIVDDSLPFIYGDRVRLGQVLLNLFTNAIRYNDDSPHIEVSAHSDEAYVHISVADNGIGINERHLGKIFDRFYCVDNERERRLGGTGLGLTICKGIIEAHNGMIKVQSSEGIGSIFTISIPKYRSAGAEYEKV